MFIEAFSTIQDSLLTEGLGDAIAEFFKKIKEMLQRFWNWIRGKDKENQDAAKKHDSESAANNAKIAADASKAMAKLKESEKEVEKNIQNKDEFDKKFKETMAKISDSPKDAESKKAEKERIEKGHAAEKDKIEQALKTSHNNHAKAMQDALKAKKAKDRADHEEAAKQKMIEVSDISVIKALSAHVYATNLAAIKDGKLDKIITAEQVSTDLKNIKKINIKAGDAMDYLRPGIHLQEADKFSNAAYEVYKSNKEFSREARSASERTVTALARIMLYVNNEMSSIRNSIYGSPYSDD
jgi:hypothetical protein